MSSSVLALAPVARVTAPSVAAAKQQQRKQVAPARHLVVNNNNRRVVATPQAVVDANAIVQLADSLEDSIPTIAVVASLGAILYASMGSLKGFAALLGGEEATASHILVKDQSTAVSLLERLNDGPQDNIEDRFAREAGKYSECPSKSKGGSLGTFKPGQMVKEFNEAVFNGPVMQIQGPVKTQFGYHLILVTERTEKEA